MWSFASRVAFRQGRGFAGRGMGSFRSGFSGSTKTAPKGMFMAMGGLAFASLATYGAFHSISAHANQSAAKEDLQPMKSNLLVFSGNGNRRLAEQVVGQMSIKLGELKVNHFLDGEIFISIMDDVRGKDIYVIQPTAPPNINDRLIELMLITSTARRAGARRITAVIPYFGYARQDRKIQGRVPISAADVARLIESMGVDRVMAVDLHCGQIQGFFGPRVPVDDIPGSIIGVDYFAGIPLKRPVVVAPDSGAVYRASEFRTRLTESTGKDVGFAVMIRAPHEAGAAKSLAASEFLGDVKGRDCIIVDDIINTATTIDRAANMLKQNGAAKVYAFASHGVFSDGASDMISKSVLEEVVVLNTVEMPEKVRENKKVKELSVAQILAQCIIALHGKGSLSSIVRGRKKQSQK